MFGLRFNFPITVFILATSLACPGICRAQQSDDSKETIRSKEKIADALFENWKQSDRSISKLDDVCDAYLKIGKWQKAQQALQSFPLTNDADGIAKDAFRLNQLHQDVAIHLVKNRSIDEAVTYLSRTCIRDDKYQTKKECIAEQLGETARTLAYGGNTKSLQLLQAIPWETQPVVWRKGSETDLIRQRHLEPVVRWLANEGAFEIALKQRDAFSDIKAKKVITKEVLSGGVGNVDHARIRGLIEQIDSPQSKKNAIVGCLISLQNADRRNPSMVLKFCETYGRTDSSLCLQVCAKYCEPYYGRKQIKRAFELTVKAFEQIPKDKVSESDGRSICQAHIYAKKYKRSIELGREFFGSDEKWLWGERGRFAYRAKEIVSDSSNAQLSEIINAFPNKARFKLGFLVHLLKQAAEIHGTEKIDVLFNEWFKFKKADYSGFKLSDLEYEIRGVVFDLLKQKNNTRRVIKLAEYIDREMNGMFKFNFWSVIAISAFGHGQLEEYKICLGNIDKDEIARVRLLALRKAGNKKEFLKKLDEILEQTDIPPADGKKRIEGSEFAESLMFWEYDDIDLYSQIWKRIFDKNAKEKNHKKLQWVLLRIRRSVTTNTELVLQSIQKLEDITGPDSAIEVARCSIRIDAGQLMSADRIFNKLVDEKAKISTLEFEDLFLKYAAVKHYKPMEYCLAKKVPNASASAVEYLSSWYLSKGQVQRAIGLAEHLNSQKEKSQYLEELARRRMPF